MDLQSSKMRSFATAMVHRAVRDVRRGGVRQLRRYVSLGAGVVRDAQHKAFFAKVQTVLDTPENGPARAVQHLTQTVEEQRLCTVGINLGFNGLVSGAPKLRKAAAAGQAAAWLNVARCGDARLQTAVPQAAEAGSYVWVLDALGTDPCAAAPLAAQNPACAFGLLASTRQLDVAVRQKLAACPNVLLLPLLQNALPSEAEAAVLAALREEKQFYAATVLLRPARLGTALAPQTLAALAKHTDLCLLACAEETTPAQREALSQTLRKVREQPDCPLLLLDWHGDLAKLNALLAPGTATGRLTQGEPFVLPLG